jgi:hypothetical protein
VPQHLLKRGFLGCGVVAVAQGGLVAHRAATPLLAVLVSRQVECLARRDRDQQAPEVIPIRQLREAAAFDAVTEAGEGALGHVLLVGGAARQALQFRPRQAHEPSEVALPEVLGGDRVARPKLPDPVRNGAG